MHFSLATCLLGLSAVVSALPGDFTLAARQNDGRPVPTGTCCVPDTSLKEDACTSSSGQAGRCVPGGNNCGGALSCVAQDDLTCDDDIIERGKSLCRADAPGGGFIDGTNVIQSLSEADVN